MLETNWDVILGATYNGLLVTDSDDALDDNPSDGVFPRSFTNRLLCTTVFPVVSHIAVAFH